MRGGVGKATLGGMRLERKPGQSGEGREALVGGSSTQAWQDDELSRLALLVIDRPA